MGFRGHWGLGARTQCMCRSQESTVHHQSFFRNSRVDRGGATGQETPVQKGGRQPFPILRQPTASAMQPLQGVLTSLVLSTGTSS